jgi:hypothetical protein
MVFATPVSARVSGLKLTSRPASIERTTVPRTGIIFGNESAAVLAVQWAQSAAVTWPSSFSSFGPFPVTSSEMIDSARWPRAWRR